jgi:hypothetical protein
MDEAVRIYLHDFQVLEDARKEVWRQLDEMWKTIWNNISQQLEETAKSSGKELDRWENASTPGKYTYGLKRGKSDKNAARLIVSVCDPRESSMVEKYTVKLFCSGDSRRFIRNLPNAQKALDEIAKQQNVNPLKWSHSDIWSEEIAAKADDCEETIEAVGSAICKLFTILAEFDKWQAKQTAK